MNIEKFILERPFIYHLTSQDNFDNIIKHRSLLSANELISLSGIEKYKNVSREKRMDHLQLEVNGVKVMLRDQRPISPLALSKCLTDGWSVGDFLFHLNDRVFMWPTIERLWRHFNRYENEKPIIFRFETKEIFALNPHVKFCRLNSGATRANSYLGGKAPSRGSQTFLNAADFLLSVRDVAEVTFEKYCILPTEFSYSYNPAGPFKKIV
ncbi:MAG: hypothetical protein WCP74_11990 [Sphingobacteriia bacterium]|jgi:hypothetical protein